MTLPVMRPARAEDVPAILAIDAVCDSASHWTAEQYLQMISTAADGAVRRMVLVAQHQQQVLGFVVAGSTWALVPREVELENLAVAPAARCQGVGAALVRAVFMWAAEIGGGVVRLEVRSRNRAAITLYQRLGLEPIGERRGYYTGPVDDAVCMEYAVGAA